jgi:hypothetical protein
MGNIAFAWGDREARSNLAKHGVSFEEAQTVFLDESARLIDDHPPNAASAEHVTGRHPPVFPENRVPAYSEIVASYLSRTYLIRSPGHKATRGHGC